MTASLSALILAAALVISVSGCSVTKSGENAESAAAAATCNTVDLAKRKLMDGKGVTFTKLVADNKKTKLNAGVAATVSLSRQDADLGPYAPVIDYLDQRNTAWTPEFAEGNDDPKSVPPDQEVPMPKRTKEVIESAKRLDKDLANGLCPE